MFIKHIGEVKKQAISGEGLKNVLKQIPVGPDQGWKDHTLRVFTLGKNGATRKHAHDWEHVNYVISGRGTLEIEGKEHDLPAGSFAFVPPNVLHQYSNAGDDDFVMICIVPSHGDY